MKTTLIAAVMVAFGLATSESQITQNEKSWRVWQSEIESLARELGLGSAEDCTPYQVGGEKHPWRLWEYYNEGFTAVETFDEIGCYLQVFEQVWMKELRRLANAQGITVPEFDDDGGEVLYDYLWPEFLEGKQPQDALAALETDQ